MGWFRHDRRAWRLREKRQLAIESLEPRFMLATDIHFSGVGGPVPVEGFEFSDNLVAEFTVFVDGQRQNDGSGYTAKITWGDGETSDGTVDERELSNGLVVFEVKGSHLYEDPGAFPITVEVTANGTTEIARTTTANVRDGALSGARRLVQATAGIEFTSEIAQFTDQDPDGDVGEFTVRIFWGDGTPADLSAQIVKVGDQFKVIGTHTYEEVRTYTPDIEVRSIYGSRVDVDSTVNVTGRPSIPPLVGAISDDNIQGDVLDGPIVEIEFPGPIPEYWDVICDWGDGTFGPATPFQLATNRFEFRATHEFPGPGVYVIDCSISDPTGDSETYEETITIPEPPPPRTAQAEFDYRMPARFGNDTNNNGEIDLENSKKYAQPENEFTLILDAAQSTGDLSGAEFRWSVSGPGLTEPKTAVGREVHIDNLNQGMDVHYSVSLKIVTEDGTTLDEEIRNVPVRDYLFVAIGDSYSSGEGNPHKNKAGKKPAQWADGVSPAMTRENREAHRSISAASARAALELERQDPRTSVTFIFLSQSGATMNEGLFGRKKGSDTPGYKLPAQLPQLSSIVGERPIDLMTISMGGNDIGFADLIKALVIKRGPIGPSFNSLRNSVNNKLKTLEANYAKLDAELESTLQFSPQAKVMVTEYPDPTHDHHGLTCFSMMEDATFLGVSPGRIDLKEAEFAQKSIIAPLNSTVRLAGQANGWTYVSGLSEAFSTHGYCSNQSWIRRARDSKRMQGNLTGSVHPTAAGHREISSKLLEIIDFADDIL